jgi:hypothetical protein
MSDPSVHQGLRRGVVSQKMLVIEEREESEGKEEREERCPSGAG